MTTASPNVLMNIKETRLQKMIKVHGPHMMNEMIMFFVELQKSSPISIEIDLVYSMTIYACVSYSF